LAAAFHRKANKGMFGRRLILALILVVILLNLDGIGRILYPFPYREMSFFYARSYNVDPFLLAAIMKAESGFNSRAVSERGAKGLMQIMPETGRWIARQTGDPDFQPDHLFEPETNIKFGAWYLADLEKEFSGNTVLALAAYNGGRGNVREWLTSKNLSGDKSDIDQIPFPETSHYVKKVLLYRELYSRLYGRGGD